MSSTTGGWVPMVPLADRMLAVEKDVRAAIEAHGTGIWRNERHEYWSAYDGVTVGPLPSVTTILDVIDKPQLVAWKVKQAALFAANHVGTLETMLAAAPGSEADVARWISNEADRTRDKAGVRGTDVHEICARLAVAGDQERIPVDDALVPYVSGFTDWLDAVQPDVVAVEQMGVNLTVGYGGTFDMIARLRGHTWLIDLKTSKGIYPLTAGQLAAYAKFDYLGKPGDPAKYPMPKCSRFAVLHLTPEGARFIEYKPTAETWQMFQGAAKVRAWMKGEAKTVMQGVVS